MPSSLRPRLRPRGASAPEGGLSGPEGEAERAAQKALVSGGLRTPIEVYGYLPPKELA